MVSISNTYHHEVPQSHQMRVVLLLAYEVVEGDVGWHNLLQIALIHVQNVFGAGKQLVLLLAQQLLNFLEPILSDQIVRHHMQRLFHLQHVAIVDCVGR